MHKLYQFFIAFIYKNFFSIIMVNRLIRDQVLVLQKRLKSATRWQVCSGADMKGTRCCISAQSFNKTENVCKSSFMSNVRISLAESSNFWSTFFYDNISTKHEDRKNWIKNIWKYKWLNLHCRHSLTMKAEEDINIWRCIYSSL